MQKKYFSSLNGLRFIGAFAVILCHIEFIKSLNGLPNLMNFSFYKNTGGHLGVILFFVLSGFLITYLLMVELKEKSTINILNFYMRRVLRIWPLYFLMIFISIFLLPSIFSFFGFSFVKGYSWSEMKYYLFFLPNVAKSMGYYINGAVHLWSVGVEEQFYLIWPLLILVFRKNLLLLLLSVFFGITFLPFFLDYTHANLHFLSENNLFFKGLQSFVIHFKINSMAIGGIVAYIVYREKKWLNFLKNNYLELVIFVLTIILWGSGILLGVFNDEVYSLLFGLIIMNFVTNKESMISLENKVFNFLGKISYGLYVYHWVIILIIIEFLKKYWPTLKNNLIEFNIVLYGLTLFLSIIISYFSYEYFEKVFLKYKNKYE